jgi:hypothetical protein
MIDKSEKNEDTKDEIEKALAGLTESNPAALEDWGSRKTIKKTGE